MTEYIRQPQDESERVRITVSDNRYQSIASLFLFSPQSQGYTPLTAPSRGTRDITINISSDLETIRNISSLGYDFSEPFIMGGFILNDEGDESVERIRLAYDSFKNRLDESFFQTKDDFLLNQGFFNFQNFFAKNAFTIKILEGLLDTRNSLIYRSNSINRENNQILMENSIFGRTLNNNNLIRNYYENLYVISSVNSLYPSYSSLNLNQNQNISFINGLNKISNYFNFKTSTANATTNRYINFNLSDKIPKISMSKKILIPENLNEGILLTLKSSQEREYESPYFSLTNNPIFPNRFITPFINPFNYSRINIPHGLSLSSNRLNRRSQNIGFSIGGNIDIQDRTPFINKINKTRIFKSSDLSFLKKPSVDVITGNILSINEGVVTFNRTLIR